MTFKVLKGHLIRNIDMKLEACLRPIYKFCHSDELCLSSNRWEYIIQIGMPEKMTHFLVNCFWKLCEFFIEKGRESTMTFLMFLYIWNMVFTMQFFLDGGRSAFL